MIKQKPIILCRRKNGCCPELLPDSSKQNFNLKDDYGNVDNFTRLELEAVAKNPVSIEGGLVRIGHCKMTADQASMLLDHI